MHRRDLLSLSPLALASTAMGRVALAQSAKPTGSEALFNVHTYGATGDGKTVDTPAINKAIDAVAAAGGGTLLFPSGTYVCVQRLIFIFRADVLSWPPILPNPARPPAITAASTIPPAQRSRGKTFRIMATTTGPTPSSSAKASVTSRSPVPDSYMAKAFHAGMATPLATSPSKRSSLVSETKRSR
jgi:hypothetical protein